MADIPAASTPLPDEKQPNALLRLIREEFSRDMECERENWEEAVDDLRFLALDQWREEDKQERDAENRPWLTFDLIGEKIKQITGDMRMNRPAIKVRPAEKNDQDLSDVFTGVIRHIEYASDAQTAYVTAGMSAARCGIGNFRIVTQYTDDESFNQEIRIQRMKSPFSVIWDADAQELTREDARRCYVLSQMTKAAFEAMYPGADTSDFQTTAPDKGVWVKDWYKAEKITVAEYWRKEPAVKTIALMPGGKSVDVTGKTSEEIAAMGAVMDAAGAPRIREVKTHKVVQYIVNGAEILEGPTAWAGKYIPIIPVWGEEIEIGDQTIRMGAVRSAKDPQRIANFAVSAAVETMAQSPKAPFIGTVEQFTGLTKFWDQAHKKNWPYLPYNPDPKAPGPPQRSAPPTLNVAALELFRMSAEGVKAGMGMHDASIGARSNETSGKAILARQREGDVGSFTYSDNLTKAVSYCGRQLVDLIPKIYDTERIVRILGEDDSQEFVAVNQMQPDGTILNDLSAGTYDVVVETGPSYSTKRAEAAETTMQLAQAVPQLGVAAPDLLVKSMDIPLAQQIGDRLKKMLPPGLAEPEQSEEPAPPPQPPPEVIAQQQQAEQESAQKAAEIEIKNRELDLKVMELAHRQTELDAQTAQQRRDHHVRVVEMQAKGMPASAADEEGNPMANPLESMAAAVEMLSQAIAAQTQALQKMEAERARAQAERDAQQAVQIAAAITNGLAQQNAALMAAMTAPRKSVIDRSSGGLMTEVTTTIGNA